jgi:hypothetical protein
MTSTHTQNLLRRTAVAIAALAVSLVALPAAALTVTLKDAVGTGNCTYSGMAVDPAGNVTVTCSSSISTNLPPPSTDPAGTFNVTIPLTSMQGPATGAAPQVNVTSFTVARSGGTTGDVSMTYTISGTACWTGAAQMGIPSGAAASTPIGLTMIGPGTCTVTISNLSAGVLGASPSATINVTLPTPSGGGGGGSGGTVPTVAGCPTPDASTQMYSMPDPAAPGFNLMVASGVVASIPIKAGSLYPTSSVPPGHLQESLSLGESPITYTPSAYTLDMSMSRCPGVITNTNTADQCNMTGYTQQNGATFTWSNNQAYAKGSLLCYVPDPTTEQWYINIRYRYSTCKSAGVSTCGWTLATTS